MEGEGGQGGVDLRGSGGEVCDGGDDRTAEEGLDAEDAGASVAGGFGGDLWVVQPDIGASFSEAVFQFGTLLLEAGDEASDCGQRVGQVFDEVGNVFADFKGLADIGDFL